MSLKIDVFPCLSDNYGFLLIDGATGKTAAVDAPDAERIVVRINELGLPGLDYVLSTHWHRDHAGGNAELKARFGCAIHGPQEVADKWPVDHVVTPGEVVMLGKTRLEVMDLSGHTLGLIGYHDAEGGNVFVADCLFPLGCGRMFEGTAQMYWASLLRLCALPDETRVYSAHEYTQANLAFAESLGVDAALAARAGHVRAQRERGEYTVPSFLGEEKATNPFLRYPLQEKNFTAQAARFGALRAAKDVF